jgi:hypothetical protein
LPLGSALSEFRSLRRRFWTAVAKRSGDTAFARVRAKRTDRSFRPHEGGVALRFPPHSMTFGCGAARCVFALTAVLGLMTLCVATSALAEAPGTSDTAGVDKPYASIIARNMFGLLPVPTNNPDEDKPPADPPPKITPNGIMTIFGREQALFKVAAKTKPGQPAKEDSHVLAEGEREDDIEVVKINAVDGIVTFNNHGAIQELPLVAAKETGGPSGPPGAGGVPPPSGAFGGIRPGMPPADRLAMLRARQAGQVPASNPNTPATASSATSASSLSPGFGGNVGGNVGGNGQPTQPPASEADSMTPEQQAFLIETQRKVYEDQGNPLSTIMPPTSGAMKQVVQQLATPP